MKIKKEHYKIIEGKINQVLKDYPNIINEYETGDFFRSDRVKNLQTRFNYDLFYLADLSRFACELIRH